MTCCLRASDEEIDSDPDAFDCDSCEVRLQEAALTDHDRAALQAYGLLSCGVVKRLQLAPLVFDGLGFRMTRPEVVRLIEKLDVIERDRMEAADEQSSATEEPDG